MGWRRRKGRAAEFGTVSRPTKGMSASCNHPGAPKIPSGPLCDLSLKDGRLLLTFYRLKELEKPHKVWTELLCLLQGPSPSSWCCVLFCSFECRLPPHHIYEYTAWKMLMCLLKLRGRPDSPMAPACISSVLQLSSCSTQRYGPEKHILRNQLLGAWREVLVFWHSSSASQQPLEEQDVLQHAQLFEQEQHTRWVLVGATALCLCLLLVPFQPQVRNPGLHTVIKQQLWTSVLCPMEMPRSCCRMI